MKQNAHSNIEQLLDSEHQYWKQKGKEDKENAIAIHGGECEIIWLKGKIDDISIEFLRKRHGELKRTKSESKLYELANISIARDKMKLDAIIRIGTKLKEM